MIELIVNQEGRLMLEFPIGECGKPDIRCTQLVVKDTCGKVLTIIALGNKRQYSKESGPLNQIITGDILTTLAEIIKRCKEDERIWYYRRYEGVNYGPKDRGRTIQLDPESEICHILTLSGLCRKKIGRYVSKSLGRYKNHHYSKKQILSIINRSSGKRLGFKRLLVILESRNFSYLEYLYTSREYENGAGLLNCLVHHGLIQFSESKEEKERLEKYFNAHLVKWKDKYGELIKVLEREGVKVRIKGLGKFFLYIEATQEERIKQFK